MCFLFKRVDTLLTPGLLFLIHLDHNYNQVRISAPPLHSKMQHNFRSQIIFICCIASCRPIQVLSLFQLLYNVHYLLYGTYVKYSKVYYIASFLRASQSLAPAQEDAASTLLLNVTLVPAFSREVL